MPFNLPAATQPAPMSVPYGAVFEQLGALWQAVLPPYGILATNCHPFVPKKLAPNWEAGPICFNYPTVGEWIGVQGHGTPAEREPGGLTWGAHQYHLLAVSTAVLTGPPAANHVEAAYKAGVYVQPLIGALMANRTLDGAVHEITPLRYTIGKVELGPTEDYFGLVVQSLVQLHYWYPQES